MGFIITKKVFQFTYYLSDIHFDGGEYIYDWNGLKDNALVLTESKKRTHLAKLKRNFRKENFSFIKSNNG